MPGAPFIYYGDEIGMNYVEGLTSVEGGYGRTGSRSPMQWDSTTNAGFSSASKEKLYIPLDSDPNRPTVEAQLKDENSLYHEIKRLITIRQSHTALQSKGEIEFVYAEKNTYPFAYLRSDQQEKILVILNPSAQETTFSCKYVPKQPIYTFGGEIACQNACITVPACSAGFYLI